MVILRENRRIKRTNKATKFKIFRYYVVRKIRLLVLKSANLNNSLAKKIHLEKQFLKILKSNTYIHKKLLFTAIRYKMEGKLLVLHSKN